MTLWKVFDATTHLVARDTIILAHKSLRFWISAIHPNHYYFTLHHQYLVSWLQNKYTSSLVLGVAPFGSEYSFHSSWHAFYQVFASVRVKN